MATTTTYDDRWWGTSDAAATLRSRASATPAQRLAWLEECLLLAATTGALASDRKRRQARADAWAASLPLV